MNIFNFGLKFIFGEVVYVCVYVCVGGGGSGWEVVVLLVIFITPG